MIYTRYGALDYLDATDRLAERHNLRMDALWMLDAAAYNRSRGDERTARRQERQARVLLAEVRDTFHRGDD